MRLRCLQGGRPSPFIKGRLYDVAEILELPLHCMVRNPKGQWPKPGERWFAWHPEEWFASPPTGLPALSCGYDYEESHCYGVIIPASSYRHVPRFASRLQEAMHQIPDRMGHLWYLRYRNVRTSCCTPKLERSFYLLGTDHESLGREISYKTAAQAIRRVLSLLQLPELRGAVDDLDLEFWHKSWRAPGGLTWPEQV